MPSPSNPTDPLGQVRVEEPAIAPGDGQRTAGAVVRPSLVASFRRDLAAGVYYPRERLVEADLAARYHTTRAAIREALVQLAAERYVETEPNRGARVRPMSIAEAIEIAEVRRALESLCAARAAVNASEAERREVLNLAATLREAASSSQVGEYLTINARFHSLIYAMSRHTTSQQILEHFQHRPIDRFIPGVFRTRPPSGSVEEHQVIAAAIAAGDASRAETATFVHLTDLIETLRQYQTIAP